MGLCATKQAAPHEEAEPFSPASGSAAPEIQLTKEEEATNYQLVHVLHNDTLRKRFQEFCAAECSDENVLFWAACQHILIWCENNKQGLGLPEETLDLSPYASGASTSGSSSSARRTSPIALSGSGGSSAVDYPPISPEQARASLIGMLQSLITTHLLTTSEKEVDITYGLRKVLTSSTAEGDLLKALMLVEKTQKISFKMMAADSYKRFTDSSLYRQMKVDARSILVRPAGEETN